LARVEDLFIQTRYLENLHNIYNTSTYFKLASYAPNNNYLLTILLNKFYESLEKLVKINKQFALYGFGHIGQIIHEKYKDNIISIIDQNFIELNKKYSNNIIGIESIETLSYDYILITVLGREKEIESLLINKLNIPDYKILKLNI